MLSPANFMNCFPIRGMLSDTLTSARLLGRAQFSGTERLAPRWDFQVAFCPYSLPLTISKSFKNWAPRQGVLPRRPISCIPWGIKIKKNPGFYGNGNGRREPESSARWQSEHRFGRHQPRLASSPRLHALWCLEKARPSCLRKNLSVVAR
jgi:hypothetical protein